MHARKSAHALIVLVLGFLAAGGLGFVVFTFDDPVEPNPQLGAAVLAEFRLDDPAAFPGQIESSTAEETFPSEAAALAGIHGEALDGLLENCATHRRELIHCLTNGLDPEGPRAALAGARAALIAASGPMFDAVSGGLEGQEAAAFERLVANLALDPALRNLDLSAQERSLILEAQTRRDAVRLSALNWYRPATLADANATFAAAVSAVLGAGTLPPPDEPLANPGAGNEPLPGEL